MEDICAILVDYAHQSVLSKALNSLKPLHSSLHSIIVLHRKNFPAKETREQIFMDNVKYLTFETNQLGIVLNDAISSLQSEYVLFLQHSDYLAPHANRKLLQLTSSHAVLGYSYQHKNISIHLPLLVKTSLLKEHPFLLDHQLPFKEALFPAWFSCIDHSLIQFQDNIIRKARVNSSRDFVEKQNLAAKYQLKKIQTSSPSLTILIANFNMEKYIETAISSCLFQNETPDHIFIIDDGSTDGSYQRMKNWNHQPGVQIFQKENEGKAKALNDLLPQATTDFILELDADDWLDPDAVSIIKKLLVQLPEDVAVLFGNLRRWKQSKDGVLFKQYAMGRRVIGKNDLLSYRFPLGPRIYRTSLLKQIGGFPVTSFKNGRLYEDVSVLHKLITRYRFKYNNFTVYNVREHNESITKQNPEYWKEFLRTL